MCIGAAPASLDLSKVESIDKGCTVRVEADGTAVMEVLPPAARNGWIDFVMLMDYTLAPSNGICHILNFVNGNHFEYIRRRKYDIPPRTK